MPINSKHPDYLKMYPRWEKMNDALSDEDQVQAKGEDYLPMTGGMRKSEDGEAQYDSYRMRARFPDITTQALTGIVGLLFEDEPLGVTEDVITNSNQTNLQLSRDVTRAVSGKGRDILVVDAPRRAEDGRGGGEPFIARYAAEALINWKVADGNPSDIELAVFEEEKEVVSDDKYIHETETVYRKYEKNEIGAIEVSLWRMKEGVEQIIEGPDVIETKEMPIIPVGSIDLSPAVDPVPLLPIARCALAYYRKSATYENALYLNGSPTPTVRGISEDQYQAICEQGIGPGALWYLGQSEYGEATFLEVTAEGIAEQRTAMQDELSQAETYAVRLTQNDDTPESGTALSLRASAQHASIYSIATSVSMAITRAQQIRAAWAGQTEPEAFVIQAEFEADYAGEQMITALNNAVNSNNAPKSALFETIRKAGLSEKDDAEMQAEIDTNGGNEPLPDD